MRPTYMLVLLVLVSIGTGVAIGRDSFFGALALGVVALIAFIDFFLNYRRDSRSAKRWHMYRRVFFDKLVAEHKDRVWKEYESRLGAQNLQDKAPDMSRLDDEAARAAEKEMLRQLGPPY